MNSKNDDENKRKKCFVITPIGEEGSSIRRHIDGIINASIRPALKDKYDVKAAHEFTTPGSINNQVIVEIYNSDLVVANLTELNPNVMYELAIRHALKKPVIMIMEKGTKGLPFDVNNERTIFYINDSQGVLDLKNQIIEAENSLDKRNISNPIFDALNNYIADESIIKNIETTSEEDANALKLILNKINKLEALASKNSEISATVTNSSTNRYWTSIDFKYTKVLDKKTKKEILLSLIHNLQCMLLERYDSTKLTCKGNIDTGIKLGLGISEVKSPSTTELYTNVFETISETLKEIDSEIDFNMQLGMGVISYT